MCGQKLKLFFMEAGKTGFGACSRVDLGEFVLAKTGCIRSILNVRGKLLLFFNPCYMAHWSWCSSVNIILEIDCEQLLNQIHYAEDHVEWLLVSLSFLYYSSLYSQSYCNWNELILLLTKKKKNRYIHDLYIINIFKVFVGELTLQIKEINYQA